MTSPHPWEVLDETVPVLTAPYSRDRVRMLAVGLRDGGTMVWSPGTRSDAARAALAPFGDVRFLLAPNHFHNAGLDEWKRAYPNARVVAHPRAHARLRAKVPAARDLDGFDALVPLLPDGVQLLSPPNAKQGETFVRVDRGALRMLAVCDAIANIPQVSWPLWVLGFRAGLARNPFFERFFAGNRKAYRAWWREQLSEWSPNVLVPGHGPVVRGEHLGDALRAIVT